ncbi:type 4a pilus biogenesis protein PilO [Prochlorococcus marinus]|uniref:Pilus assembly protein PilO n=1 Tax=Prochlorococcus marinus XMU1408 TaxID=2213228 RepID=A0A318R6Q3_PROMR|nr:type 4a pilus biogenesis protein PilO [Prochlorococcus marinus]PYE01078.1 hypothetical protein DNJ73_06495 [Prochlorococcus marinus XMU1408]
MTNLSSNRTKNKYLTPENSVFIIPIFTGIFTSIILILSIFTPLMYRLKDTNLEIKILEEKISYIPIYKKYINKILDIRNMAKKQQDRLINIISDPNHLKTVLSEINKLSLVNNLSIEEIEPIPIVRYTQNKINTKSTKSKKSKKKKVKKKTNSNLSKNKDVLLLPSLEKHTFKISLTGKYNNILVFLKEVEFLQPIVLTENINIKSIGSQKNNNLSNENELLKLSFDLSTYAQK